MSYKMMCVIASTFTCKIISLYHHWKEFARRDLSNILSEGCDVALSDFPVSLNINYSLTQWSTTTSAISLHSRYHPHANIPRSALVSFSSAVAGLTAAAAAAANAAIAEAMKVKKIKLEVMSSYHANSTQHGADHENGDLASMGKSHCHSSPEVQTGVVPNLSLFFTKPGLLRWETLSM